MSQTSRPQVVQDLLNDRWRLYPHTYAEHLSAGKWVPYRHLVYLSKIIGPAIARGNARFVVSMPPRHGKSEMISKWLCAWFLDLFPEREIILTSYEADYAASWGRKVRDLMSETPGILTSIRKDSKAADRWHTTRGGSMRTAGMGGSLTGKGAHLLIIDDPVKNWKQAQSETTRKDHQEWFESTAHSRIEPGGSCIIIQTRWHERDLAGWVLSEDYPKNDRFIDIKLEAIASERDPIGREPGEALCPERFPIETLESIRGPKGGMIWNAVYQQTPSAQEGNIWKRHWMTHRWRALPEFDVMIQSWDCAFKGKEDSDYVVGQVWGKKGADMYLVDQVRAKMDFNETVEAVKDLSAKWPKARKKLIENKANGPAVEAALKRQLSGISLVEPDGGKEARAYACAPEWESGNVYLPDGSKAAWVQDFIEEATSFPNAAHDDQVDAASQALNHFASGSTDWLRKINQR